jgi:hypothetical protein
MTKQPTPAPHPMARRLFLEAAAVQAVERLAAGASAWSC